MVTKTKIACDTSSLHKSVFWCFAIGILIFLILKTPGHQIAEIVIPQIAKSDVLDAVELAQSYLIRACKENGQFVYRAEENSEQFGDQYNVVRHAGAIYCLGLYEQQRPDPSTKETMLRSSKYLVDHYLVPVRFEGRTFEVIWARPKGEAEHPVASLGAAGLGLVALCAVEKLQPKTYPLDKLTGLGDFLLYLQKEDGNFYTKFDPDKGPSYEDASLYYPGEAALGLFSLYDVTQDKKWLIAGGKALAYLAKSRKDLVQAPPDCWALIATARFLPNYDQSQCPASEEELIQHASRICQFILTEQVMNPPYPEWGGGFDAKGRTTPTATRLESLLSALKFLPEDRGGLRTKIERAVRFGMAFLLKAQIKEGPLTGGMPLAIARKGETSTRAGEVRIDYVQHALSAFLHYEEVFYSEPKN